MHNIHDEKEAQAIIESACSDYATRRIALSIFGEAICEANICGRDQWALRVEKTLRLTVKHYYVCTLSADGVWLALDDRFNSPQNNQHPKNNCYPTFQELKQWGWTPDQVGQSDAYPTYQMTIRGPDFSINGSYQINPNHHDEAWPHVRRLFFDFIYKAIYYGQPMDPRTPGLHSSGALKYLRNYLGTSLPDPLY